MLAAASLHWLGCQDKVEQGLGGWDSESREGSAVRYHLTVRSVLSGHGYGSYNPLCTGWAGVRLQPGQLKFSTVLNHQHTAGLQAAVYASVKKH